MSKRLILPTLLLLSVAISPAAQAQEKENADKKTVKNQLAYFLGISVGQQFRQTGFRASDFGFDDMLRGFEDGINDADVALSPEQLQGTQQKITELLTARRQEMVKAKLAENEKFLAENAAKEGIKKLEGGVQYKVLASGDGDTPAATDTVKVHYTGKLTSGKVFDSSIERGEPATFRVNQVIQGWQMALQAMKVGDKWMLYIPSELAYGERGSQGAIGPNEVLIFEVELLAIQ